MEDSARSRATVSTSSGSAAAAASSSFGGYWNKLQILVVMVLKPAGKRAVEAFLDTLRLFGLGFSWGGFESLALNADPQFDVRKFKPDFGGPAVRLNIGLEDADDLIADLRLGLDAFAAD